MSKKIIVICSGLLLIWGLGFSAVANESQVDKIRCEPVVAHQCTIKSCMKIEIINVYTSRYLDIDIKNNRIVRSVDSSETDVIGVSRFKSNKDSFVFYGNYNDNSSVYDWVLRINKNDGKMIATSVDAEKSNTIFGECKWGDNL